MYPSYTFTVSEKSRIISLCISTDVSSSDGLLLINVIPVPPPPVPILSVVKFKVVESDIPSNGLYALS